MSSSAPTRSDDGRRRRTVDFWGFYVDVMTWYELVASRKFVIEHERLDKKRDAKWDQMVARKDKTRRLEAFCKSHRRKLKSRVRKGVPRQWRPLVWPALLEVSVSGDETQETASKFRKKAGETYAELVSRTAGDAPKDSIFEVIERDLCRTYPKNKFFDSRKIAGGLADRKREALGVGSLRNVLRAYATLDQETEYCQGMNYVAALLLIHVSFTASNAAKLTLEKREEEAFWLFVAVLRTPRTQLRELYLPGMPGARRALAVYDGILKITHPRLWAHFERENCIPDMYATHWMVTVFSAQFPFALVTRVWDMFLAEGWKPVYRVAVAVVGSYEERLLGLDFEHLMAFLRDLPQQIDVQKVLDYAQKIKFPKTARINDLENHVKVVRPEENNSP